MKRQRIISVVGSWRPVERKDDQESKQRFVDIARAIGTALHDKGYILRVSWSNDHLYTQCRPQRNGEPYIPKKNKNGTYAGQPSLCRFLFQDTADYHTMTGYMDANIKLPRGDARIELEISKEMYFGARQKGMVAWPPIADLTISGQTIKNCVESGLINITHVPGDLEPEYLRSSQLLALIDRDNSVDVILGLGGGKASHNLFEAALPSRKLIPLPYCGGEAEGALARCYAQRTGIIYERLSYVFGKSMPSNEVLISKSLHEIGLELDSIEHFFSYPYRIFVACPFGYSAEEQTRQLGLFKQIESAIRRVCEENADDPYPGAEAFRLDQKESEAINVHSKMFNAIEKSGVVFCELTPLDPGSSTPNANVYFELGYARGVSDAKRYILFARHGTHLPFDISNLNVKFWHDETHFEELCYIAIRDTYNKIRHGITDE